MSTWPILNKVNKHKDSSYLCSEWFDHFLRCFASCSFFPSNCYCLLQLFSCPFKLNFLKLGFTSKIFHLRDRDWSDIIVHKYITHQSHKFLLVMMLALMLSIFVSWTLQSMGSIHPFCLWHDEGLGVRYVSDVPIAKIYNQKVCPTKKIEKIPNLLPVNFDSCWRFYLGHTLNWPKAQVRVKGN